MEAKKFHAIGHDLVNCCASSGDEQRGAGADPHLTSCPAPPGAPPDAPPDEAADKLWTGRASGPDQQSSSLAFGRQKKPDPEIVSMSRLMVGLKMRMSSLLGENIGLTVALPDEALVIRADVVGLLQSLTVVVLNAGDAMPHGGEIDISVARVGADTALATRHPALAARPLIRISVAAAGAGDGISIDALAETFGPFVAPKRKMAGLGLTSVFRYLKDCGGAIEVDIAPGARTTFNIYLPADASQPCRQQHLR